MSTRSSSRAQRRGGKRPRSARKANRLMLGTMALLLTAPLLWMGSERLRAQDPDTPIFVQQTEQLGQQAVEEIEQAEEWSEERDTASWDAMGKARSDVAKMREMISEMADGPQLIENPPDAGMADVDGPAMHKAMNGLHELYMMKKTQEGSEAADEMMDEMKNAMRQRVDTWSGQLDAIEEAMLEKQAEMQSP